MFTGMQMKAAFESSMSRAIDDGARIAYLIGRTGSDGGVLCVGVWFHRVILHANDNRRGQR